MSFGGGGGGRIKGGRGDVQEMFFDSPNLTRRRRRRIETNVTKNPTPAKEKKNQFKKIFSCKASNIL